MVNWSTGHWWGNFKATLIAPLTPQALSWSNHKQVLLSAILIASFAILLFGKEAENNTKGVTLLELVWIDLRQIQHKKAESGEVFLIWEIRLSQWAGNVAICQGKGKKRHYLLQISECKAMTNKSHFMQFKDKKKT